MSSWDDVGVRLSPDPLMTRLLESQSCSPSFHSTLRPLLLLSSSSPLSPLLSSPSSSPLSSSPLSSLPLSSHSSSAVLSPLLSSLSSLHLLFLPSAPLSGWGVKWASGTNEALRLFSQMWRKSCLCVSESSSITLRKVKLQTLWTKMRFWRPTTVSSRNVCIFGPSSSFCLSPPETLL